MSVFATINSKQPPKTSLRAVRSVAAASLQNEQVTRKRVDQLEMWAGACARTIAPMTDLIDYLDTGIWARLRWLALGNAAITPKRTAPVEDAPRVID